MARFSDKILICNSGANQFNVVSPICAFTNHNETRPTHMVSAFNVGFPRPHARTQGALFNGVKIGFGK